MLHRGPGGPVWLPLGVKCAVDIYGGEPLAALPLLTVRLDPRGDAWDIYAGAVQLKDGLPFSSGPGRAAPTFTVQAGEGSVQVFALVLADENPIFVDANANGIDDAFEVQRNGGLLSPQTAAAAKDAVLVDWRKEQPRRPGAALSPRRTAPDRVVATIPPGK